ncbi:serine-rich adhesin for platelets-like [Euwallacea similis]|uniref:serine-rich adhesin for platelets-like n=1 Tax=Euwallacea similis TaxID=1736056 RepID=UPI00344D62E0
MSRKTAVSELQSRETTDSHSPVRRSARIFSGNNTPSGLGKRNSQADIPAKATKTRRGSAQLSEDDSENTKKDLTSKDSQQAPVRRGRKSSVTTETTNKEEPEKPKTVRTRRNSRAASEEKEKPPPKAVKGRKSSVTSIDLEEAPPSTSKVSGRRKRSDSVDSEPTVPVSKAPSRRKRSESADIKTESPPATTKIPARASTRRRTSVTEEATVEGTSTPAKRTTRGRKTSDLENVEEDVKPTLRKGLRSSTEDATVNTPSKTPRRLTRRNSFTAEIGEEAPIEGVFKEVSVKITPIKKKLIEKVEAELDLSVINESSGDLNVSKQSLNDEVIVKDVDITENNLSMKVTPTKPVGSEDVLIEKASDGNAKEAVNNSLCENSPTSRKRQRADDNEASTSKSPKITSGSHINSPIKSSQVLTPILPKGNTSVTVESEKFSLSSVSMPDSTTQIPDTEVDALQTSKDSNQGNLDVEEVLISKETPIEGAKVQEEVLNTSKDSNKENLNIEEVLQSKEIPIEAPKVQENALNVTKESNKENLNTEEFLKSKEIPIEVPKVQEDTLSTSKKNNKDNLDIEENLKSKENSIEVSKVQEHTLNTSKDINKDNLGIEEVLKSKNVRIEAPIVNTRVSNVFRPNQKESSFVVEPMEVDDLSIISADNSIFDKISASGENSVVSGNAPKSDVVADTTIKTIQESLSVFNKSITSSADIELTTDDSSPMQDGNVTTIEKIIRLNAAGSEESDNVVVEETEDSVDISCIPKFKKTDTVAEANKKYSLILNTTVDNVKILNRKSSSPISQKKLLRKSKSPITVIDSSSDNEDDDSNKLHINRVRRRSKLKSKTPSPKKLSQAKIMALESAGSRNCSVIEDLEKSPLEKCKDPNRNKLKTDKPNRKSKSKTPSPVRNESTSVVTSSKSASPKSSNVQSGKAKIKRTSEGTPRQINAEVEINLQGSVTPNLSPPKNKRLSRSPTFIPWEKDSNKVRMSRGNKNTITPVEAKRNFSANNSESKETLHSNDNTPIRKKSRTPTKLLNIEPESSRDMRNSTSKTLSPNPQNVNEDENRENVDLESKSNQSPSNTSGDIEKSRSDPKFSQSTHYDFELPSDEEPTSNSHEMSVAEESAMSGKDVSCAESLSSIKNQSARLLETTVAINSNELNFSKMSGFSNTDTVDLNESVQQKSRRAVENIALESSGNHEKSSSDNSKTMSFKENDELIEIVDDKEMSVIEDKSELGNRLTEIKDSEPKCSVTNHAISVTDAGESESVTDEESNECNNTTKEDSTEKALSTVEAQKLPKITCLLTRLEDFASAKVHESLANSDDQQIEELDSKEEEASSSDENESEQEYNDFIDGMAEEGEEDTPSEDSNQIVDEGEYIGSSETDEYRSDDNYDSKDSFICDDEEYELLSGDEYDLENEKKQKKERTIVNTLEEKDNIAKITKKKLPIKKSRIIRPRDSSSEDEEDKALIIEAESSESEKSIIVLEDSPIEQATAVEMDNQRDSTFDNSHEPESLNTEETTRSDSQEIKVDTSIIQNTSTNALNNSIQKRNRKNSLSLQENIVFDGIKDPMISQRISTLVESFCSTVTKGEVSLNLSLEYEDTLSQDKERQKTAPVKVLSSVKICPASSPERDPLEDPKDISTSEENLSRSLDGESGKRRKKLKRRLSKSLSELYEEETKSKRRRKNSSKAPPNLKPAESYNLMTQLITDVKNRPKRTIKPSLLSNVDSSWISSEVIHMKPSTTAASREEMFNFKAKLHPKDFKNKLLSDPTRVKRIHTKALLKKKGAFL